MLAGLDNKASIVISLHSMMLNTAPSAGNADGSPHAMKRRPSSEHIGDPLGSDAMPELNTLLRGKSPLRLPDAEPDDGSTAADLQCVSGLPQEETAGASVAVDVSPSTGKGGIAAQSPFHDGPSPTYGMNAQRFNRTRVSGLDRKRSWPLGSNDSHDKRD